MAYEHLAYGVDVEKNAEIQHLTKKVALALSKVAEQQAIVDSLQVKSDLFAINLAQATAAKASTLANYNLGKDTMASVNSLADNFDTANKQAKAAVDGAVSVSEQMAGLMGNLIFSVEFINTVTSLINKKKSLNAVLSQPLVDSMAKATSYANNAVALTLTALQSCYAAESTLLDSRRVFEVAGGQATALRDRMDARATSSVTMKAAGDGLLNLLKQAYDDAVHAYSQALSNSNNMAAQQAFARTQLMDAVMMLSSWQSGHKAATAAAYAA